ncbi:MarR family transcriptional regulator [Phycicoccus sp. CSK15P-2]|uniref:MarR family winged helix-turn-helix transcriptional regulator n=1 Tax=Phycicoccus sp. CSK15P-2 TaxID=2807627 RepID=UPI0019518000|nr:MarR family transcriptional regulator [Phycicoccus sp. CSK15P-2]MBM6403088.1 MarR family transcriptional regulator [Phycicoccus sp. CSK15P-2]
MSRTTTSAGFGEEQLATWSSVATLLEWLPGALDAQLQRDAGLSHFEFGVLFALSHATDSTLRLSTLADHANSTLSRLSRAVTRLEGKGWVHRSTDPDDGRYTRATLTASGRRKVADASPGHVEAVTRLVFDPLTAAQTRQLREISRRITTAIRPDGRWEPPGR